MIGSPKIEPQSLWLSSPVQYWIDSKTQMVLAAGTRDLNARPAQDHTTNSKHAISFVNAIIDERIAAEVFTFTPPADAVDASDPRGRCGISIGGSGGGSFRGPGGEGRVEHRHSHEWGDTLIERYKLRVYGIDLTFERRLTFSEDRRELRVSERIIGTNGEATRDLSLFPLFGCTKPRNSLCSVAAACVAAGCKSSSEVRLYKGWPSGGVANNFQFSLSIRIEVGGAISFSNYTLPQECFFDKNISAYKCCTYTVLALFVLFKIGTLGYAIRVSTTKSLSPFLEA